MSMSLGAWKIDRVLSRAEPQDERQELAEHLGELRTRLIRAAVYVVLGMIVMYAAFPVFFHALAAPIVTALKQIAAKMPPDQRWLVGAFVFHNFFEPFFLRLQISLIAGLVAAAPFITLEIWGFVLPALTSTERRSVRLIAPFSVALFAAGAALAFWLMPNAVHWFLLYLADFPSAILLQDPQQYILFVVKMMLAFGVVFQLPIMMMALAKLGVIRSKMLVKYWRYIVVGISIVAMVVTPSNDPFSMIMMAIPLVILFFGSISLVKLVEPKDVQGPR